ncbi:hypothetical protein CR513_18149, partial [Mucuna pruriens]
MECTNAQKLSTNGRTFVLAWRLNDWLSPRGTSKGFSWKPISQNSIRNKKEIKFLKLRQENMFVADYSTKFEELSRMRMGLKCVKFINNLRPEIKQVVNYQEIKQFPILVNRCRVYDEYSKARERKFGI